jgi:hypothetical protein
VWVRLEGEVGFYSGPLDRASEASSTEGKQNLGY